MARLRGDFKKDTFCVACMVYYPTGTKHKCGFTYGNKIEAKRCKLCGMSYRSDQLHVCQREHGREDRVKAMQEAMERAERASREMREMEAFQRGFEQFAKGEGHGVKQYGVPTQMVPQEFDLCAVLASAAEIAQGSVHMIKIEVTALGIEVYGMAGDRYSSVALSWEELKRRGFAGVREAVLGTEAALDA